MDQRLPLAVWGVLALAALAVAQAPPNDLCSNAIPVFDGVNPGAPAGISGSFFTNAGAFTEGTASCVVSSFQDVWFSYTATATGSAAVKLTTPPGFLPGTLAYAVLSVYAGCGGAEIACNPSASFWNFGVLAVPVTAGTTYLVRVAGNAPTGTFYLTISTPVPPPTNDLCTNSIPVFDGINPNAPTGTSGTTFTNFGAGTESSAACAIGASFGDVWFTYTATASGFAYFGACVPFPYMGASGSVVVSVRPACAAAELACFTPPNPNATGYVPCGPGSTYGAVLQVTTGTTYLIRVAGTSNLACSFYLTVIPPAPTPPNDACANAMPVTTGVTPVQVTGATNDGTASCMALYPLAPDVWCTYSAPATGVARFATCWNMGPGATSTPVHFAVFSACGGTELACGSSACPLVMPVIAGNQYTLRIATASPNPVGACYLTILPPAPPPANDECSTALPVNLGPNGPFMNTLATQSPEPLAGWPAGLMFADTWYSFTSGTCPGGYDVDTWPETFAFIEVYGPCGSPVLVPATSNVLLMPQGSGQRVTFAAAPLTTYRIRVVTAPGYASNAPFNVRISSVTLSFSSPGGPGCLQANLTGLPSGGLYYIAATFNQGTFPVGPLHGISITLPELTAQLSTGAPFTGSANACGNVQLGPFCGLPSGATVYSVAFGFVAIYGLPPSTVSLPIAYTIP